MPSSYREELISQIPAAHLLVNLGYQYLPPAQALELRGGSYRQVVLTEILADWLRENNRFTYKGHSHTFNESAIAEALRRITDVHLSEGLKTANEQIYELLTLGFAYNQTVDGDTRSYDLHFIDWQNPENNVYHITEEFVVERERSHQTRRPDLVCFVNGLPLVVIECKRPDLQIKDGGLPYEEAISQMLGNQKEGQIRHLFAYSQLLLALSTNHAAYGTTATDKKFWAIWKEEQDAAHEERVAKLICTPLKSELDTPFFDWRDHPYWARQQFKTKRLPTEQDRALVSLLDPARLLELAYQFIVFDGGVKKIARYQQYFAVKATLDRVAALNAQGERTGGVIWHTTGSGKSLTMVMLAKALVLHPSISNPRVILVTDRVNLDRQIYETFDHCGHPVVQATSGRHLIELVQSDGADIIATVQSWVASDEVDAVVINGGTGISPRDQTPEAMDALLDRRLDGFGELFRMLSHAEIGSAAMLSRASAGIAKNKPVYSIPGSRGAVRLAMTALILPEIGHVAFEARKGIDG